MQWPTLVVLPSLPRLDGDVDLETVSACGSPVATRRSEGGDAYSAGLEVGPGIDAVTVAFGPLAEVMFEMSRAYQMKQSSVEEKMQGEAFLVLDV